MFTRVCVNVCDALGESLHLTQVAAINDSLDQRDELFDDEEHPSKSHL